MATHIVIMAGGVGSRLYPLSTPEHPKQFLDILHTGRSLIQMTYERFLYVDPDAVFWVVTSASYAHFIREQLPQIPSGRVLLEPEPRNTAPCISYVSRKIALRYPGDVVVVTPSDAYVPDCDAFALTMKPALSFASGKKAIICIGIKPTSPHTGYGYIHAPAVDGTVVKVESFKEKPDQETAKSYLAQGGYYWNAGIFIWNVDTIESELSEHVAGLEAVMDRIAPSMYGAGEEAAIRSLFPQCEKISIDYAVLEKSSYVYVAPADWEWTDLGSFEAIEKVTGRKLDY